MNVNYVIADAVTGRILQWGHTDAGVWRMHIGAPESELQSEDEFGEITPVLNDNDDPVIDLSPFTFDGRTIMQGDGKTDTHYVSDGEIAERPAFPAIVDKTEIVADGVDAATISGIPNPADIVVNGETVTVADGVLVLTADTGAVYELSCQQWPYLDWSVTITATPPGA